MVRSVVWIAVWTTCLVGCKSYETEWRTSQGQLLAAEARIDTLQQNVRTLEQAVEVRDRAIAERDAMIRDECVRRTRPKPAP